MKKILFSIAMLVLTTAAFSQECFQIIGTPTLTKQLGDNYTLSIVYNTTGNKALEVIVTCNGSPILNTCFINNGNGIKTFENLSCPSGEIVATLIPHTGSCNGAECGTRTTVKPPAGGPIVALPVKLSAFSAVRSKQVVSLKWNTEFELDAKEFIVERAEGTEFRSVGTISSNGNSTTQRTYSFNDKNDNAGITYYRLKNVDLNGKFTYSQIRTVKGIGAASDVTVFPNPARVNSNISINGVSVNSSIQLLDFSGKIIKNMNSGTNNTLDLMGVKNGTYLIRIVNKATNEIVNKTLTVSN